LRRCLSLEEKRNNKRKGSWQLLFSLFWRKAKKGGSEGVVLVHLVGKEGGGKKRSGPPSILTSLCRGRGKKRDSKRRQFCEIEAEKKKKACLSHCVN